MPLLNILGLRETRLEKLKCILGPFKERTDFELRSENAAVSVILVCGWVAASGL
jgi:hypothetical protein